MKTVITLLCFSSILSFENSIQITIPSVEEETEYVWRTLIDIKFFEEHNYEVSLPDGELIDQLKEKSKANQLTDEDFNSLLNHMKSNVYKRSDYEKGCQKIEANRALINKMTNELRKSKRNWAFKEFDQYEVKLTLYGSGGSYNPETGSIIIYTTKEGEFKQYENPANTIIHEIIHIGTEESIMNKYQLPHPLKERIIDKIVLLHFKKYLPSYRLQGFGDARIDKYLKNKKSIKKLEEVVAQFQKDHLNQKK